MVQILTGVRPSCIGMVAGVIVSLSMTNYVQNGAVSLTSVAIGLVDLALLLKWKVSIPKVICLSAVLGLICFGVFQLPFP